MKRIPSLDGLRAISIAAVIAGHLAAGGSLSLNAHILAALEHLPHFGVRVFFVVSGFLITTLIFQEREETGTFSLARFYERRAWRIFPPAYAFLLCLVIANLLHVTTISKIDFVRGFTYLMNYGPVPNWFVGHLWSLSVEEQFYIIWPFLLVFLPQRGYRAVAVAFILVSAVLHFHLLNQAPENLWRREYEFQYAGTSIVFGCLLAIERPRLYAQEWFRRICLSPFSAPIVCVVFFTNSALLRTSGAVGLCAADILTNLCIVFLVAKFACYPVGPIARMLNWKPMVYVGGFSYSLYLWQQLFTGQGSGWTTRFPANLLLIIACALASYYLVEKPTLRMRKAITNRTPRAVAVAASK
jgi:peptidoglycan/LPS O-acetylase OafA/YrhL